VVLTADLPVVGHRERDLRNRFEVPRDRFANLTVERGGELIDVIDHLHDPSLSWDDLAWVRSLSRLPLVLKGVMTAEDAVLALEHGVDAVIVSNHGGRQLDRARAAIDALEEVVAAAGGRCEVYLDSGIRRGVDVLVALALGARGVFLGRPYLYALAAGGEAGVDHCLYLMRAELENAMALLGVISPDEVGPSHLA
jgi:isopentenyl diphosphate isomerase/L-lactate dehydrogenase-like FMN-dependent dehydrogenase